MILSEEKLSMLKRAKKSIATHDYITVYDTETSGLRAGKDRILSFSAIRFKLPEMVEDDRLDIFIQCPFSIPQKITEINHIDDAFLEQYGIDEFAAFKAIDTFLGKGGLIAGQNIIAFDNDFMNAFYAQFGQSFGNSFEFVDTVLIARAVIDSEEVMVFNERYGKMRPSYALSNLVKYFELDKENDFNFHASIEDVKATAMVLQKLIDKIDEIIDAEEKKREPVDFEQRRARIQSVSWFNPSSTLMRIYINTDQGTFFYDLMKDSWDAKPGYGNLLSIDINALIKDVFEFKNVGTIKELISVVRSESRKKTA